MVEHSMRMSNLSSDTWNSMYFKVTILIRIHIIIVIDF